MKSNYNVEYQLKYRIVGAIIVVSVAVWGIPLLLSKPENSSIQYAAKPTITNDTEAKKKTFRLKVESPEKKEAKQSTTTWSVRVGTFSQQKNIDTVIALLASEGLKANKTRMQSNLPQGATRIWLGPYAQRKIAETVNHRLKTVLGEKGLVTENKP